MPALGQAHPNREPRKLLNRLVKMSGGDHKKLALLMRLRSQLDPFALLSIILNRLERIWQLCYTGKIAA